MGSHLQVSSKWAADAWELEGPLFSRKPRAPLCDQVLLVIVFVAASWAPQRFQGR